jgi:hypothetical protein
LSQGLCATQNSELFTGRALGGRIEVGNGKGDSETKFKIVEIGDLAFDIKEGNQAMITRCSSTNLKKSLDIVVLSTLQK